MRWVETFLLTHFFTLEFARPTSDKLAVKRLLQWQDALERVNRSAVGMLFGLETEPELPAHGVLPGNPGVLAAEAERLWRRMAGDPRVRPYDRSLNSGAAYALKEAFWTQSWDFEHLEFYSPTVRMRRARRTREFFFQSLRLPVGSAA